MKNSNSSMWFRVYWKCEHPKKKKQFHVGEFEKRQQARNWCRNNVVLKPGLTIVHPDGKEEKYHSEESK